MKCTISQDKAFKILEWLFFIGFSIVAGWFALGVVQKFLSRKTGFTQHEEEVTNYPVISMVFSYQASEINLTSNVVIRYHTKGMMYMYQLKIGENNLRNEKYNKTEKVILESHEDIDGMKAFRIIHETPILEKKRPYVDIRMYTKIEKNDSLSDLVVFYATSQENSPGFIDGTWKDGKPLQFAMNKNSFATYNMQPQSTKYLEQIGKCQKESYYKCITSQLDVIEFNKCSRKCIPKVFSNMGKNYSTQYCQNDTDSQQCIFNHMLKQEFGSNCTKSCSYLEYVGDVVLNVPY